MKHIVTQKNNSFFRMTGRLIVLSVSVSISLSLSQTYARTHSLSLSLSLSPFLTLTHTHSHKLTQTHTHTSVSFLLKVCLPFTSCLSKLLLFSFSWKVTFCSEQQKFLENLGKMRYQKIVTRSSHFWWGMKRVFSVYLIVVTQKALIV